LGISQKRKSAIARKLQKVSVYIRIRLADDSQPHCRAIWESKKNLRPHWCLVRGTPEHHREGIYHVRYRVYGKPVWEKVCMGDDPKRGSRTRCPTPVSICGPE